MTECEFTCESCHQTFPKAWTDEEALEEALGAGFEASSAVVVCDDCYREIIQKAHAAGAI